MKALILNSGTGSRMGELTKDRPKCMTKLSTGETILSRQLHMLYDEGIDEAVITTGAFADALTEYVTNLSDIPRINYVYNPLYAETNYIYSIYLARDVLENDDIILMHGDLVFERSILGEMIDKGITCMAMDSSAPLPDKDFKVQVSADRILCISTNISDNAMSAQPLYLMKEQDFELWLESIARFCDAGNTTVYAEEALNNLLDKIKLSPFEITGRLCQEIDDIEDLNYIDERLCQISDRTVYLSFSTDIIHSGHLDIIRMAGRYGKVIAGVLSDRAVASYKRFPIVPYNERAAILEKLRGIDKVVCQDELSYSINLRKYRPSFVVHGDDWKYGIQKSIREETISLLTEYGGQLIEFPYHEGKEYESIESRMRSDLSIPDFRRGRLKRAIELKGCINAIEAHSGITGLIAEETKAVIDGEVYQFDAMWVSSLCDSTAKGKPDMELVDMTSRVRTIDDILEVTTKPIIFDGDTGGLPEHFVYNVRTLERMGVSMIIIEDKIGLKKNSLFGTDVEQTQDTIEHFCEKISAGKRAKKTNDFMIVARIESLILERGMEDALLRAFAYVKAGADGIMIHSRKKEPDEVFAFIEAFRAEDTDTPLIIVPTTYNRVTENEWKERGVNVIIYANHLMRSGFPAMRSVAETILKNHRAYEADKQCMPIKDILTLIPEDL